MVNDLQNIRCVNIVHCLGLFIVIHQDQLFLLHTQQVTSGHSPDILSMLVHYRECPVPVLDHHILDIICKIIRLEGDQVVLLHDVFDRDTLIDKSCHSKGVQR